MNRLLLPSTIALACALALPAAHAQSATEAELARRLDALAAELAQVKAQLSALQQQRAPVANTVTATPAPVATAAPATTAPIVAEAAPALAAPSQPATVLSGYGEINFNLPTRAAQRQKAQADVRRFVLGYQHRLDERTRVVAELEVEHAVSSSSDAGEVEVEQAYVERQITPTWALRGGLFLMPVGLLNENHEPTAYYGVERNFVETAIIPTTWREGGVQAIGTFDNGLTFQGGLSTGFDLTKWDATSTEGAESPLGAIHQEMSLAKARQLAVFGAANWRGIPGLLLGGSVFTGGATHGQSTANASVTLVDLHARYTPGRWDLAALYSAGRISNTAKLNAALIGNTTLIPASFDGAYVQAAYKLWQQADYTLSPFVRVESVNTGRRYADLGAGVTPAARATERIVTVGANLNIGSGLVVKADWQTFRQNKDSDRLNLGLGWSF